MMVVGHTVSWSVLGVGVGIGSAHAKLETGHSDQELARAPRPAGSDNIMW